MTNLYRAMCAKLVDAIFTPNPYNWEDSLYEAANRARALLAQPEPEDRSQISDGCHTFAELYEHRHGLTLALMKAMPRHFWFSQRHHDGELCFGEGKWFIIGAELPDSGEITYHLPNRLWGLAQLTGATELEHGPTWDGHTAGDVVHRLKAWAACPARAQPEPEGVSADEWDALVGRAWDKYRTVGHQGELFMYDSDFCNALDFVRKELAPYGRPTPQHPQPPRRGPRSRRSF